MATAPHDRRAMILDEAAGLFARQGIAGTTVREIADAVGILSGSLYHHFAAKDEIAGAIMTRYLEDLLGRYRAVVADTPDPAQRLERLIAVSFEVATSRPHETEMYQSSLQPLLDGPDGPSVRAAAAEIQATWIETIGAGVDAGELRSDVEPAVFYRFLRDALWLSVRWFRPGGRYSVSRLAADYTRVFLEGYATRPDDRGQERRSTTMAMP
ncbi:MAG: TetR/AcrR family transcriptional regulator [Lapillicoccus sp.]